jgi:hypothetical protein
MGKIDDTNNDALYFIAICLILMQDNMFSDLWDKFEDDIINHNRFFQNNEIIDEINGYMDKATYIYPKVLIYFVREFMTVHQRNVICRRQSMAS